MAKQCLDMGFCISIPGTITFRNAGPFQEIVRKLPLESLLIETDAPFLSPVPFRGKRNEPSFVRYTAQKIAELKGIPFERVAEATSANALRVFRLEHLSPKPKEGQA
jgi:TatD DNase family protein